MAFDPTAVLGGGAFLGAETGIEFARPIYRSARGIGSGPRRALQTSFPLSNNNNEKKDYVSRIFFVILSALVFISVISSFEVARIFINNYYSDDTDQHNMSKQLREEAKRRKRERINNLKSILVFAVFAIVISIAIGAALLAVIKKNDQKGEGGDYQEE